MAEQSKKYIMFAEDEQNFIYIIRPIDQFVHDSLFAQQVERGLTVMSGTFNDSPSVNDTMQSLLFSKSVFNREQVENFLQSNKEFLAAEVEADEIKEVESNDKEITITLKNFADKVELREIKGVEIFAVGEWNGDAYSVDDLDEMVRAFNDSGHAIKPVLKLGHNAEQALLQKDGLPAAGWIGDIYRQGDKLYADFVDIPRKIFELIKNKAFKKVSAEIYWNLKVGENIYKRLLSAVALLGSDMPAVSTLDDILALYGLKQAPKIYKQESKIITYDKEESDMSEEKVKELEAELKEFKAAQETKDADLKVKEDEIAELKQFKIEKEAEADQLKAEKVELERNTFVDGLEIPKSAKEFAKLLISEEVKTYKLEDKEFNKEDALKELLKLQKSALTSVNFDDNSGEGDNKAEDEKELIEKYMAEHKVNFADAYKAVIKK